jgi:integrase/recombinase XerD
MSKVEKERLRGPLSADAESFASELVRLGYSKTGRRQQMRLFVSLNAWLDDADLSADGLDDGAVEAFLAGRRATREKLWSTRSLAPLVGFLQARGRAWPVPARPVGPLQAVVDDYESYLRNERGLADGTIAAYVRVAGEFLDACSDSAVLGLEGVTASAVTGFVTRSCSHLGLSASRATVSALRCFVRHLALEGLLADDVDGSILSVAGGGQPLPRGISPDQVDKLLASCDRRRGIGRRDYAILMLLARLGLRGGEIVGLLLEDIDWRNGEITVRGNGPGSIACPCQSMWARRWPPICGGAGHARSRGQCSFVIRPPSLASPAPGRCGASWNEPARGPVWPTRVRIGFATQQRRGCCAKGPLWQRSATFSATANLEPPPSTRPSTIAG